MAASEEAKAKIKVTVDDKDVGKAGDKLKKSLEEARKAGESELKKLEKASVDAQKKMYANLATGAKDAGKAIVGGLKVATIAGAAGALAMMRANNQAASSFRNIAFAMRMGGGATMDWSKLQKKAFEIGKQFGTSQEDVAAGMQATFAKSGDAGFAAKGIESIAAASLASGQSMETLGTIAGELNAKFGVTGENLDDALAKVLELGNKGGMSVEEIAGSFDAMGKSAAKAGLDGIDGFTKMMALSTKMGDAVGGETAALAQLSKVLVKLGPAADAKTKAKLKSMGVGGKDAMEVLGNLMSKTGGDEAKLSSVVGAQGASFLSTGLGKGGFDEAMADAAKSTAKGSDVRDEANKRAAEDPEVAFKKSMSKIAERFAAPDAMAAMDRLTKALPQLADAAVAAVNIISDHPKLAMAGAAVGLGGGQAASMVSSVVGIVSSMRSASAAAAALKAAQAGTTAATTAQTAATTAATTSLGSFAASLGVAALAAGAVYLAYDQLSKLNQEQGPDRGILDLSDPNKDNARAGKVTDAELRLKAVKEGDVDRLERMRETKKNAYSKDDTFGQREAIDQEFAKDIESAQAMKGINKNRKEQADLAYIAQGFGAATAGAAVGGAVRGASPQQRTAIDKSAEALTSLPSRLAAQELKVRVTNPEDIKSKPEGIFDN